MKRRQTDRRTIFVRHQCPKCPYSCPAVQGLSWHEYWVHGSKHPIRNLVTGTACYACMQKYHTRERLIRHLMATSSRCALTYFQDVQPLSPDRVRLLEEQSAKITKQLASQGKRREHTSLPIIRLEGPLVSKAFDNGISFYSLLKKPRKTHKRLERGTMPSSCGMIPRLLLFSLFSLRPPSSLPLLPSHSFLLALWRTGVAYKQSEMESVCVCVCVFVFVFVCV